MAEAPRQSEGSTPSHVELATLFVPAAALEAGIVTSGGGGDDQVEAVVLQASQDTCETLIDNDGGGANDAHAGSQGVDTTCIQAVVDLAKLSELVVGVTESEFVVGLHREAHEQPFSPDLEIGHFGTGDVGDISLHDVQPHPTTAGEEQPLLTKPSHKRQATADISLDVTPFVETLADVLPSTVPDDSEKRGHPNLEVKTTTTTSEDEHQLGHDAFLLEVPQHPGEAEHQHHFVLALPEIQPPHEEISMASRDSFVPMLEKAFSMLPTHLPTDVKDVQLEATSVPVPFDAGIGKGEQQQQPAATELHLDLVVKRQVPLIGYIILISGLVALSSVGTALDLQGDDVTPSMKTYWRVTATALALLPFAVRSIQRDGLPKLSPTQWTLFPLAALAYGYMTTAFVVALSMTSLVNSFVLSNLTSLVIIVGKATLGLPILLAEGSGAVIGFTGAAICAKDPSAEQSGTVGHPYALLGDLIALSASFGMAAYICIAKDLRNNCDLFVFMFVIMSLSSVFVLAFMVLSGETVMFSAHPDYGLWGWINLSGDRLPLELYMVYVCNFAGTLGYIAVLKYFDSVVVATIMLMEPVIAAFIGFAAGVDPLPGVQTWIGDVVVAIGSGLVIFSGARKTESIDATEAMRPRSDDTNLTMEKTVEMMKSPVTMKGSPHRRMHSGHEMMQNPVTMQGSPHRRMNSGHGSYRSNSARIIWD